MDQHVASIRRQTFERGENTSLARRSALNKLQIAEIPLRRQFFGFAFPARGNRGDDIFYITTLRKQTDGIIYDGEAVEFEENLGDFRFHAPTDASACNNCRNHVVIPFSDVLISG